MARPPVVCVVAPGADVEAVELWTESRAVVWPALWPDTRLSQGEDLMEIKTHLESHGIKMGCCVCGQGYELMLDEMIPRTHEAYRHGQHLGVICCDCFMADDAWLRTMLELPTDEPILHVFRPRYLEIETGQFDGPEDRCLTCNEAIADDETDVVIHLRTDRQGYRVVRLSHRRCYPVQAEAGDGHAHLCILTGVTRPFSHA